MRDAETRNGVANAEIKLADSAGHEYTQQSDSSGTFHFDVVPPGSYQLTASADGYMNDVETLDVKPRVETPADVVIMKRPKNPLVAVTQKEITIKQQVQFAVDSAVILPESNGLLTEIADVLLRNPRIHKVEIQGHTDSNGDDNHNQVLSEDRANSVRTWLVSHGVSSERLDAKGYGEKNPLVPNVTEGNRQKNRRVQFIIIDQDKAAPAPDRSRAHGDLAGSCAPPRFRSEPDRFASRAAHDSCPLRCSSPWRFAARANLFPRRAGGSPVEQICSPGEPIVRRSNKLFAGRADCSPVELAAPAGGSAPEQISAHHAAASRRGFPRQPVAKRVTAPRIELRRRRASSLRLAIGGARLARPIGSLRAPRGPQSGAPRFFFCAPDIPEVSPTFAMPQLARTSQTPLDRPRLDAVVEPIARAHGAEVVDLEFKSEAGGWVLRLFVEKLGSADSNLSTRDAAVDLSLCSGIARDLSPALDVADLIPHRYHLEISSPGVERPLKKERDFVRFAGKKAKLKLHTAVSGSRGEKVVVGILQGVEAGKVKLADGHREHVIPLDQIATARLVFEFGPAPKPGKQKKK